VTGVTRSAVCGTSIAKYIEMATIDPGDQGGGFPYSSGFEARTSSPLRLTLETSPVMTSCKVASPSPAACVAISPSSAGTGWESGGGDNTLDVANLKFPVYDEDGVCGV